MFRQSATSYDISFNTGESEVQIGTSCSALKKSGIFNSGHYVIKDGMIKNVFEYLLTYLPSDVRKFLQIRIRGNFKNFLNSSPTPSNHLELTLFDLNQN